MSYCCASMALLVTATLALAAGCDGAASAGPAARNAVVASTGAPRIRETTFDDVKFEMATNADFVDDMITPEIEARFGKAIRIRGYIFPPLREKGLKQFVLVRDNLECCFGPGAALYDCMLVYLREGAPTDYTVRPITVEGTFRFDKKQAGRDGPVLAIYRLDDAVVQ